MACGNQLDRQWRLLQLIERPSGVTVENTLTEQNPDPVLLDCHNANVFRA